MGTVTTERTRRPSPATRDDVLAASKAIYDGVKALVESKHASWEVDHGVRLMKVLEAQVAKTLESVVASRVKMAVDLKLKELEDRHAAQLEEYEKRLDGIRTAYESSLASIKELVKAATKPRPPMTKNIAYDEYGRPTTITEKEGA